MVEEENKTEESSDSSVVEQKSDTSHYIEAIKKIKEDTVSKEDYQKLKDENKMLLDAFAEGKSNPNAEAKVKEEFDFDKARKELFNPEHDLNNLEYVEKALKLRKELIASGKPDPFLPSGKNVIVEQSDIDKANNVAEVLQECIDYADGDSEIFTNELARRTKDTNIRVKR